MKKGFLYILSNPVIRGLKIGISRYHPEDRVRKLSEPTGVPKPYQIEYWGIFDNYEIVEKKLIKNFINI